MSTGRYLAYLKTFGGDEQGGVSLPTLSSPASASDIYQGTEAIDQAGAVVMGTNPYNAAVVDPIKASALTAIADKGVATTGDEALSEIPGLIDDIVTPNNQDKTITENGTYTADAGYTGLGTVTVDVASSGGDTDPQVALIISREISYFSNSQISIIGENAFANCSALSSVSFEKCSEISDEAFLSCISLENVEFPNCVKIGSAAFFGCNKLIRFSASKVLEIGNSAFQTCYSLVSVSFPSAQTISSNAFQRCSKLGLAVIPNCLTIGNSAFQMCSQLRYMSCEYCVSIGSSAFSTCYSLNNVSFPMCETIGSGAFDRCDLLSNVTFPNCRYVGSKAFSGCSRMRKAQFEKCSYIGASAFQACYMLSQIVLSSTAVCQLAGSNAFTNASMIQNSTGYIYVPSSLVDAYKSATNWTYFSNQISAIEDSEFA